MILQALYEYYQRKAADPGSTIAPHGLEWKEIPYLILIDKKGNFLELQDTTEGVNPAKRKAMAVKNEKRFLKQKRNALKNPGYSHHPVKTQASFKRLLKAV